MNSNDINFEVLNNIFTCRVVVLIEKNNKILFQKRKADKVWALPGGKLSVMEKTEDGAKREIFEELGCNIRNLEMLSVTENFFKANDKNVHQYIFTYKAELDTDEFDNFEEFDGIEVGKNVVYRWIEIDRLSEFEIRPDNIKEQIEDMKNKVMRFYKCEG